MKLLIIDFISKHYFLQNKTILQVLNINFNLN